MPEPVAQEKGHIYHAETPNFHKGETGKGASVKMGPAHNNKGTSLSGGDKYAQSLRSMWSKAVNAAGRFSSKFS